VKSCGTQKQKAGDHPPFLMVDAAGQCKEPLLQLFFTLNEAVRIVTAI
jgi:hypothetical protein